MTVPLILLDIDLTPTESWIAISIISGLVLAVIYFIRKYLERIDKGKETTILFGKVDLIIKEIGDMKVHAAKLTVTVGNTNALVREMKDEYLNITDRLYDVEIGCVRTHARRRKIIPKKGG